MFHRIFFADVSSMEDEASVITTILTWCCTSNATKGPDILPHCMMWEEPSEFRLREQPGSISMHCYCSRLSVLEVAIFSDAEFIVRGSFCISSLIA
jgi:hypothetical protein